MSDLVQLPEGGGREPHGAGLIGALARGFVDLAGSTARCLERRPKSVEIYGWLVLAGIITLIGTFPVLAWGIGWYSDLRDAYQHAALTQFAAELLIVFLSLALVLLFFPLYMMLIALLVHVLVRYAFGGRSGLRATVIATSWASMLIALVGVAGGFVHLLLLVVFAGHSDDAIEKVSGLYGLAFNLCVFSWIWSKCVAGAHRLRMHYGLFAILAIIDLGLYFLDLEYT